MAKLWDRLRRRFGGRDEQEHEAGGEHTADERPVLPLALVLGEPEVAQEAAPETVIPPAWTARDEPQPPFPPAAWEAPHFTQSAPLPGASDELMPGGSLPATQPFDYDPPPVAPIAVVEVAAAAAVEPGQQKGEDEGGAPFNTLPAELWPLAPIAPEGEHTREESISIPGPEDAAAGSLETQRVVEEADGNQPVLAEYVDGLEGLEPAEPPDGANGNVEAAGVVTGDDWLATEDETDGGADDEDVAARAVMDEEVEEVEDETDEPEVEAPAERAPTRRRGRRREPSELDGQPARLVLPGRPLKRNEVPTLDTPLFLWSHDADGAVVVQPTLYACVQTQWYGPSLYFLIIPWEERDASERSARLVVDATQLRVAPAAMAGEGQR